MALILPAGEHLWDAGNYDDSLWDWLSVSVIPDNLLGGTGVVQNPLGSGVAIVPVAGIGNTNPVLAPTNGGVRI